MSATRRAGVDVVLYRLQVCKSVTGSIAPFSRAVGRVNRNVSSAAPAGAAATINRAKAYRRNLNISFSLCGLDAARKAGLLPAGTLADFTARQDHRLAVDQFVFI